MSSPLIKSVILVVVIVILNCYYSLCAVIDYENPLAQTVFGQVRGRKYTFSSSGGVKNVAAFIGIPYARPPTGADRFAVSAIQNCFNV
jgi:hypothetical protein